MMAAWLAKEDVPWGRMNEWKAGCGGGKETETNRGEGEKGKEGWERANTVETGRFLAGGGFGSLAPGESPRRGWLFGHSQHHPEAREGYQLLYENGENGNRDGGPKLGSTNRMRCSCMDGQTPAWTLCILH